MTAVIDALARDGSSAQLVRIEVRDRVAHASRRILHVEADGPHEVGTPELGSFPSVGVVAQLLRFLPQRPEFADDDSQEIRAPWEALSAFALAPEGTTAAYVKSMLRWATVPEPLLSLRDSVSAEFLVTTACGGPVTTRWWVSGDAGWVGLGLEHGEVLMVPSTRDDIARALSHDVAAATAAAALRRD